MIESDWEDLCQKNSHCGIFICFYHYFQLNLDETSFLCNEGKLRIFLGSNKSRHNKNCSDSRFSIKVLRVGSAAGVNAPVIFLEKRTKVHQRLRGKNLVTKYGFPEGSCVVPKKTSYMDD